jgi:RNA polymerase subunit RPABC4/transcription elongation factor Spt4
MEIFDIIFVSFTFYIILGCIVYFIFCIIVGCAASNRGRSGFGYFFLSLILSPLIAFIIILVLGENKNIRRERIYEDAVIKENVAQMATSQIAANQNVALQIAYNDTKKCPFCAEIIKREAIVCRFCGRDLPEEQKVEIVECKKCGENITIGDTFCPYCGSSFEENRVEEDEIVECKKCGKNITIGDTFCGYCGSFQFEENRVEENETKEGT